MVVVLSLYVYGNLFPYMTIRNELRLSGCSPEQNVNRTVVYGVKLKCLKIQSAIQTNLGFDFCSLK